MEGRVRSIWGMIYKRLPIILLGFSAVLTSAFASAQPSAHAQHHQPENLGTILKTPSSIAAEHRELHETLEKASKEGGPVGSAARELEAALSPHFRREEQIATPPLGLLPALATGQATTEMRAVLPMTTALQRELPKMLREHQAIRAAVGKFRAAADSAGRGEYVRFSDDLAAHAREEEEILYPAAILVGRYVAAMIASK